MSSTNPGILWLSINIMLMLWMTGVYKWSNLNKNSLVSHSLCSVYEWYVWCSECAWIKNTTRVLDKNKACYKTSMSKSKTNIRPYLYKCVMVSWSVCVSVCVHGSYSAPNQSDKLRDANKFTVHAERHLNRCCVCECTHL